MNKSPDQIRAQARGYRELHSYLNGPVMTQAIEDVALALDRLAASIEQQAETVGLTSRPPQALSG